MPSCDPTASTTSDGGTSAGGTSDAASAARVPTTTSTGRHPPVTRTARRALTHGTPWASWSSALGAPRRRPAPAARRIAATLVADAVTAPA